MLQPRRTDRLPSIEQSAARAKRLGEPANEFARSVLAGLGAEEKSLDCRWFYDARGSRLFEQICVTPEYYVTRAESEILRTHAAEIARDAAPRTRLVELGSGSARKTRHLIRELCARQGELAFAAIDISRTALEESARELAGEFPSLDLLAICGDYEFGLRELVYLPRGPKLVLSLGSSIGNFPREEASAFLRRLRARLAPDDRLLLGIDLRKDAATLERAYDDAEGVTARFNLNLLARINRELGGEFDLARFAHRAHYNAIAGRIDMHLQSLCAQRVRVAALGRAFEFAAGELIHTESSFKYSLREIDALAHDGGWRVERRWSDSAGRFSLNRLRAAS